MKQTPVVHNPSLGTRRAPPGRRVHRLRDTTALRVAILQAMRKIEYDWSHISSA